MRLADDIVVSIGGASVRLRPTLRAAIRLERRHGLLELLKMVAEGNLTAISDLIRETAFEGDRNLLDVSVGGLARILELVTPALLDLVLGLLGADPDAAAKPAKADAAPVHIGEALAKLYGFATGWCGYSPAVALDSTPTEILAAYEAKLDFLRAIHGAADAPADDAPEASLDDQFAVTMARLGGRVVKPEELAR
jgi:hypothetical protein